MDALCIGNATLDVFVRLNDQGTGFTFDKFSNQIAFRLGDKIKVDEYVFSLGGNACNVSVGLKRLGIPSSLASQIGGDEFSDKILNTLKTEGVATENVERDQEQKPFFNILLSYQGERSILEEEKNDRRPLKVTFSNPRLVYLTSLKGDWEEVYQNVLSSLGNSLLAFNPGTAQLEDIEKIKPILERTNFLFVNISEAQKITGVESFEINQLFTLLKKLGPKTIVITDASNGSYANHENDIYHISPFANNPAKERTGAGDSYATGFLYAILNEKSAVEALKYGAINAYSVIQEIGAQKGLLEKKSIEEKAIENKELVAVKI